MILTYFKESIHWIAFTIHLFIFTIERKSLAWHRISIEPCRRNAIKTKLFEKKIDLDKCATPAAKK